jgi:hypothetical protein
MLDSALKKVEFIIYFEKKECMTFSLKIVRIHADRIFEVIYSDE